MFSTVHLKARAAEATASSCRLIAIKRVARPPSAVTPPSVPGTLLIVLNLGLWLIALSVTMVSQTMTILYDILFKKIYTLLQLYIARRGPNAIWHYLPFNFELVQ